MPTISSGGSWRYLRTVLDQPDQGQGAGQEVPPEPPQNPRTGEGPQLGARVANGFGQEVPPEPRQNPRTGEGATDTDVNMHRQSSAMSSSEPEPMPSTPLLAPSLSSNAAAQVSHVLVVFSRTLTAWMVVDLFVVPGRNHMRLTLLRLSRSSFPRSPT